MLLFVSLFFFSMSYFYIHHTVYKDRPLILEYNFRDFDIRPIFLLDKASNDDVYYSLFILFINHPLKSTSRFLWFIEPTIKVKWQTEIIAVHMFFFRPTGIMYTILLYSMYLDTMLWFFFEILTTCSCILIKTLFHTRLTNMKTCLDLLVQITSPWYHNYCFVAIRNIGHVSLLVS